jgi:hypothetical protein
MGVLENHAKKTTRAIREQPVLRGCRHGGTRGCHGDTGIDGRRRCTGPTRYARDIGRDVEAQASREAASQKVARAVEPSPQGSRAEHVRMALRVLKGLSLPSTG